MTISSVRAPITRHSRSGAGNFVFALATAGVVAIGALVPLLVDPRHYFVDDSVNGAFGQWYHLGTSLLDGRFPMLEPSAWSSGNLFAEGQWGFFNPLVLAISLASAFAGDAAMFTTVIKIIALVVGGLGAFALARAYGARPEFAFLAGSAAPFCGFTTYFDAPSWVTGLLVWSLLPWFWWALRRMVDDRGGPLATYILGYLIVTVGYVHGTLALIIVAAATLVVQLSHRSWLSVRRIALLGVALGLVAVAVHITSLLTAPVTNRGGTSIYMDQFMTLDMNGLLAGVIPTSVPQMAAWWWTGFTAPVPVGYLTWLLPFVTVISWRRLVRIAPRAVEVMVAGAAFGIFIMLPTVIGPLRYPTRMLPYVALCSVLLIALGLDRARRLTRMRVVLAVIFVALCAFLAWAQTPQYLRRIALATFIVMAGVSIALWVLRRRPRSAFGLTAVVALTSLAALGFQQWAYPRPVWPVQGLPTAVQDLKVQAGSAVGDTIVIGNPLDLEAQDAVWQETLFANSWYVNPSSVVNRYQLLGFVGFNGTLCLGYLGETCPGLAESLFETRDATGLSLADELSLSSVQLVKTDETEPYLDAPPPGWHVAEDAQYTQTWVRDVPVPPAGGVIDADNVDITDVHVTPESVSFRATAAEGGTVVFSRLAWPGYRVTGSASLGEPVDGFLLSVDIPEETAGVEVTVTFRPAGFELAVGALVASATTIVGWLVLRGIGRRRASRSDAIFGSVARAADEFLVDDEGAGHSGRRGRELARPPVV